MLALAGLTGCLSLSTAPSDAGDGGVAGSGGGGGGAGGSAQCIGPDDGSGKTIASCEQMNITPAPNGPGPASCNTALGLPPGYLACKHGFEIFKQGAASTLQGCLAEIGSDPSTACDADLVANCVYAMYGVLCASPSAVTACNAIDKQLCGGNNFDVLLCAKEAKPFNDQALQSLGDCILDANPDQTTCQQAYESCFKLIMAP